MPVVITEYCSRVLFPGGVPGDGPFVSVPLFLILTVGGQGDGGARGRSFCFRPLVSGSDCWENRGTDTKGPSLYVCEGVYDF